MASVLALGLSLCIKTQCIYSGRLYSICVCPFPHAIWSKLMDSSTFSLAMLWSKQQLMKYSPLSCSCVRVYIYVCAVRHTRPGWVTPAHPLMSTHMHMKCPKKAKGCLRSPTATQPRREKECRERESTLLLNASHSCWYSYWWREKKNRTQKWIGVFLLEMAENKRANISGYNPQGNVCLFVVAAFLE